MKNKPKLRRKRYASSLFCVSLLLFQSIGYATQVGASTTQTTSTSSSSKTSMSKLVAQFRKQQTKNQKASVNKYLRDAKNQLKANGKDVSALSNAELENKTVEVMVHLSAKPAAAKSSTPRATGSVKSIKGIKKAEHKVEASQDGIVSKVEKMTGHKVKSQFGYLVNGFTIDAKVSDLPKLAKLDGVEAVQPTADYHLEDTGANEMGQIPNVWSNRQDKGQGTVVAVLDSGVDYTHKDLRLTDTSTEKITQADATAKIKAIGHGTWESDKVPYAFNYSDDDATDGQTKDTTGVMHGQHVSGIIAANGVNADGVTSVQGVAPEAQILDMKIFSNTNTDQADTDTIIEAIQDAVTMGADVMNMSFGEEAGSGTGAMEGAEQDAIEQAAKQGVISVISAGNAGLLTSESGDGGSNTSYFDVPDEATVGDPSTTPDAISVASAEDNKVVGSVFDITLDGGDNTGMTGLQYQSAGGFETDTDLNGSQLVALPDATGNANAANPDLGVGAPGDWTDFNADGKIVVVGRGGGINFTAKQDGAKAAGAKAVIIVNNLPEIDGFTMNNDIPTLEITPQTWAWLKAQMAANPDLKISFGNYQQGIVPSGSAGQLSSFSSWGLSPNLDFKPEIAGVGGNVWSLTNATGANNGGYQQMSGTSMAAPFVSGSMALLTQAWKAKGVKLTGLDWTRALKVAMENTAAPMPDTAHGTYYSPREQGTGLIQVDNAIQNTTTVTNTAVNGTTVATPTGTTALKQMGKTTTFDLTVTNNGKDTVSYKLDTDGGVMHTVKDGSRKTYDEYLKGATISFSAPTVTVAPGKSAVVTATVSLDDTVAESQFIEGFVSLVPTDSEAGLVKLSVPYVGYYGSEADKTDYADLQAIDSPVWKDDSIWGGNYLQDPTTGLPLGIGNYGNANFTSVYAKQGYSAAFGLIDPDDVSISPNGDGYGDSAQPDLYFLRNVKNIKEDILDSKGNVVRQLNKESYQTKSYVESDNATVSGDLSAGNSWNGKISDSSTGGEETAPNGKYTYRITATPDFDGAKAQTLDLPIMVDTQAPTFSNMALTKSNDGSYYVSGTLKDNLSGFNDGSMYQISVNGVTGDMQYLESSTAYGNNHASQSFTYKLNDAQVAAIKATGNQVEAVTADNADNIGTYQADAMAVNAGSVLNDNLVLTNLQESGYIQYGIISQYGSDQSSYYDKKTGTYELTGYYGAPFYVSSDDGRSFTKVTPAADGSFDAKVPVSPSMTKFTFTKAEDTKDGDVIDTASFGFAKTPTIKIDDAASGIDPLSNTLSVASKTTKDVTVSGTVTPGTDMVSVIAMHDEGTKDATTGLENITTSLGQPGADGFTYDKDKGTWSYTFSAEQGITSIQAMAANFTANANDPTNTATYESQFAETPVLTTNVFVYGGSAFSLGNISDNHNVLLGDVNHVGATSPDWNKTKNTFTIKGALDPTQTKNVVIYGWNSNPNNPLNKPNVNSNDGTFTYDLPLGLTTKADGTQYNDVNKHDNNIKIKYQYDAKQADGSWKTVSSVFSVWADTDFPTLNLTENGQTWKKSTTAGVDYDVYTNGDSFEIKGNASDNLDGYSVTINADKIYQAGHEYWDNSYTTKADTTATTDLGDKGFDQTYALDTSAPATENKYTVTVTDMMGNQKSEVIAVHRNTAKPAAPTLSESTTKLTNKAVKVSLKSSTAGDDLYYSLDNKTWVKYSAAVAVPANVTVYAKEVNVYGTTSAVAKLAVTNVVPRIATQAKITATRSGKTNNFGVTLGYATNLTTAQKVYTHLQYSLNGGKTWTTYKAKFTVKAPATVTYRSFDDAGNVGKTQSTKLTALATAPTVSYAAYVQKHGWQAFVSNGKEAGTTQALRVEAYKIKLSNLPAGLTGGIQYRAHIQNIGWQAWKSNGAISGTTGKGLREEAIEVKLTGKLATKYNVQYRAYVQGKGWQAWKSNGALAGTTGKGLRMEAFEVKLVAK